MKRATREWVKKAEDDYQLAAELAADNVRFRDSLCYHCQQSAERYLKAILEELGLSIPKTHDLERLFGLSKATHPHLRSIRRGLLVLTDYAVDIRYPGNSASRREALTAVRWAGRVRDACRAALAIPEPHRRKPR